MTTQYLITTQGLPDLAVQYYRQARSYIHADDKKQAILVLKQAIDEAKKDGKAFPEAEEILNNIVKVLQAEKFRKKAIEALGEGRWGNARENLENATNLDPGNTVLQTLHHHFENLMRARDLIEQLFDPTIDTKNRLKIRREIKQLVNLTRESDNLIKLRQEVKQLYETYNYGFLQKSLGVIFLGFGIGITMLSLIYLVPRHSVSIDCNPTLPGFNAIVDIPNYATNRDKEKIEVILTNISNPKTNATLLIDFHGPAEHKIISPSKSDVLIFKDVERGEERSESLYFQLNEPIRLISDPGRYITFSIEAIDANGNSSYCIPNQLHIAASPIPFLRSIWLWFIGGSGTLIVIRGYLWEKIESLFNRKKQ